MPYHSYRRADRKRIIVIAFQVHITNGNFNGMTVYQVCKKMGVRQSGHFQKIMMEMVDEGVLETVTLRRSDGVWKRLFSLKENHPEYPKKQYRKLVINGQQELWS